MPRKGQHDPSPGDGRKPFSDQGGPEGRHAQTHDVRREALTNPKGPETQEDEFEADLAPALGDPSSRLAGHVDESAPAGADKDLRVQLNDLEPPEFARLSVLEPGTRLQQGSTYLDLNDESRTPFTALGGQEAGPQNRYVSKHDTDYELWNRLVGQEQGSATERPAAATG